MKTYIGIDLGGGGRISSTALAGKISAEHGAPVCGLGIGAPGVVDGEKSVVRSSGNLGWEKKPLAKDLSVMLGNAFQRCECGGIRGVCLRRGRRI